MQSLEHDSMYAKIALTLVGLCLLVNVDLAAQDVSAPAAFGTITLSAGFTPDPHEISLAAGGSIAVQEGSCTYGNVANAPDVDLHWQAKGGSTLYIFVVAPEDTTLLVNTPNGSWKCDDDGFGDGDPILVIPKAAAGLYDIWVGTYGEDVVTARLFISEVDPRETP
jgi:hypothetical protein